MPVSTAVTCNIRQDACLPCIVWHLDVDNKPSPCPAPCLRHTGQLAAVAKLLVQASAWHDDPCRMCHAQWTVNSRLELGFSQLYASKQGDNRRSTPAQLWPTTQ